MVAFLSVKVTGGVLDEATSWCPVGPASAIDVSVPP